MSADGTARTLADAVRELIEQTVSTDLPEAALAAATGTVRRAVDELRAAGGSAPRASRIGNYDARNPVEYFRLSPVSGVVNPLAPPLRLEVRDGELHGECTFGRAYQGPPGFVHGACVAAAFDELLGIANAVGGLPAMTGRLEIRFHRPTPVGVPLRLVGRHTGTSGRKSFASGSIIAGDVVTAEADAVFVAITESRARELFGHLLAETGRTTDGAHQGEQ